MYAHLNQSCRNTNWYRLYKAIWSAFIDGYNLTQSPRSIIIHIARVNATTQSGAHESLGSRQGLAC